MWICFQVIVVRQVIAKSKSRFWELTRWSSKKLSHNNQGFALVFMCLLLSLSLLTVLSLGSGLILIRNKMQLAYECRNGLIKVQAETSSYLHKLLGLNPLAKSLRVQRSHVEAQLALAVASLNKPLIASLTLRRQAIIKQQRSLDRYQKFLILEANRLMLTGTLNIHNQLRKRLYQLDQQQQSWGSSQNHLLAPKISKLAIKSSDRRLAPTFEPKKDFESHQTLSLFWIQNIELHGFLKAHAFTNPRIRSQCRVTLEENTWVPKIRKDRRF